MQIKRRPETRVSEKKTENLSKTVVVDWSPSASLTICRFWSCNLLGKFVFFFFLEMAGPKQKKKR